MPLTSGTSLAGVYESNDRTPTTGSFESHVVSKYEVFAVLQLAGAESVCIATL